MKTLHPTTASKLPESVTSRDVYLKVLIGDSDDDSPKVRVAQMYYTPGSRTAWHSHASGEYLHILHGTAIVQEREGEQKILHPGDTVFTEPNVEHWHGALSDAVMTHLVIWDNPSDDENELETKWGDQVSDQEAEIS